MSNLHRKKKISHLILLHFFCLIASSHFLLAQLPPGDGYIDVKGGKLWYNVIGEGPGAPLLMMHGGPGGTSRSFYLFAALGKDRPLIIFDQLGSGRSDHHQDTALLKVDYFVEQVKQLVAALELDEFYLHGHSWGTALALEYYTAHPEGVKGIVFNSPYFSTAIWKADADTLIMTLPDSIQAAIAEAERNGNFEAKSYQEANVVFAKNFGLRGNPLRSPLDTVPAPFSAFIYNTMWGPTEFTATGTLKYYDNQANLEKVSVPALFITGEYDEARPATVQYFQSLVPGARFVQIDGAGHATMHDNLEQNLEAIRSFLNEVDAKK